MAKATIRAFDDAESLRTHYLGEVDRHAEAVRQRFISPGAGQMAAYEAKLEEARRVTAGEATDTPWLDAEAPVRGMSKQALAQLILRRRDEWVAAGATIEAEKAKAKQAIRDANGAPDMMAALKSMSQALDTLTTHS